MTTDLNQYDPTKLPGADVLKHQRYAIIVADWNSEITFALAEGARQTLLKHGVDEDNISITHVPGTVELTYAARSVMNRERPHAIIVIGCVIRGDTPHDRYICQGVTYGLARLNAVQDVPVIYGLITTLDMQQAEDRAGGLMGNKGDECAITAIKMVDFKKKV